MNLSKKTFVYSATISSILVGFMVIYFIWMLPSLYVDYVNQINLDSIKNIQKTYTTYGTYKDLTLRNPTGPMSVTIPKEGYEIYGANIFGSAKLTINNTKLRDMLDEIRLYIKQYSENIEDDSKYSNPSNDSDKVVDTKDFEEQSSVNLGKWLEDVFLSEVKPSEKPFDFTVQDTNNGVIYKELSSKIHLVDNDTIVVEGNVTDGNSYFTNYIACTIKDNQYMISYLPVMTPQINEITPIILRSIPMILSVGLLLILLSTSIFAKLIVNPIVKLSNHAEYMKHNLNQQLNPIEISGRDEIAMLGESLNELYQKLYDNYEELKEKNSYLAKQSEQQEVFLRASSHQLKTPVAASLLLVEGMMGEVGKYKDTKEYLPKVKEQLITMQKIIEDILYLNHRAKNIQLESVQLEPLIRKCAKLYDITIARKQIKLSIAGKTGDIITDTELIRNVIDNLLSNAINYTPECEEIQIHLENKQIVITNYGVQIEQKLLPHVFEPFVSNNSKGKGHGLGLYFVAYYSRLLGYQITIKNISNGVEAKLVFESTNKELN